MQLIKLIILSIVIISNPMLHADPKGLARLDQWMQIKMEK